MLRSIDLCYQNTLITSTLILIYSAIDCMAALNRPIGHNSKVQKKDFLNWCEKYIIPHLDFDCSPIDLYSARCGLLHTYSPDSSLTKSNKARKLYYSWGNAPVKSLEESIRFLKREEEIIALKVEVLIEAFKKGVKDFISDIHKSDFKKVIFKRASSFFVNLEPSDINNAIKDYESESSD